MILPSVPPEWAQDEITALVIAAGLEQATATSRVTRKGRTTWFIRGACPLAQNLSPTPQTLKP